MTRRKGEITSRQIDRDFPHQVEIEIPPGGLRKRLDGMYAFCRGNDFRTRGIGRQRIETGRDGMRWCFTTAEAADAFQAQFGGGRLHAGKVRPPR